MSNEGPNGWPKPNLLKSTIEIFFLIAIAPALIVGFTTFSIEEFKWFNMMEPYFLEWVRSIF